MAEEVTKFAEKAVQFDQAGKFDASIYFYGQAAEGLLVLSKDSPVLASGYRAKAEEYIQRAEELRNLQSQANLQGSHKTPVQLNIEKAEFLLYQAFEQDEEGNSDDAVDLYSEAVELCLETRKSADNADLQRKLKTLAEKSLERAEILKEKQSKKPRSNRAPSPNPGSTRLIPPLGIAGLSLNDDSVQTQKAGSGSVSPNTNRQFQVPSEGYTKEELAVLRATSMINGREYVPFMSVDLKERFAYPVPFTDKHGMLALANKQKAKLKQWVRPDQFLENPKLIDRIDSGTIKQTIVSDCSFIASLAIAARYERRTGKKLGSIIYPQNKNGDPVYNPCGKYMIKLNLNGVPRKVVVDDYLPMGHHGELLCSYSQNRNELWVSVLEKAYMKVMGGYDFPGSNSNIDLHALTGWIPERIAIRPGNPEFNKDAVFEKIFDRYHKGDCLATLATGQLSQTEQDRAGLVECHAYAMLDIRKVMGKRLFLVKNPWNHLRWKGRYSERDLESWIPELRKALDYNPNDAQQFDDGLFWIDYESICHFFDVFYLNWNPDLFSHTYCIHSAWSAGVGPVRDLYTVADNPQYSLEVNCTAQSTAVWVLLTRHITDKADFAENKEYITVLVYKNEGKKVYYPFDPAPYIDGTRINSPHYLCKMVLAKPGTHRFSLVVAQYEKLNTIYYTIRVYSTAAFKLRKITTSYRYKKKETGEWNSRTAGGCGNNRETYKNNPIYQMQLETAADDSEVCIELRGPKQYSVGFDLIQVSSRNNKPIERHSSGAFRPGFCVLSLDDVPAGAYNIIPTTFLPKQEGPFFLTVQSSASFKLTRLQ